MTWKSVSLAGLLLFACDFGSGSSSGNRPLAARLWHFPAEPDTGAVWSSDSLGMVVAGEYLKLYRLWNGCFHLHGESKATDFWRSTTFAAEVVPGPRGDSLRMTFTRDSLRTALLGEIPGACLSSAPLGSVTVRASDLDSGSFGRSDTLRVVVEYAFTPQAGDMRAYSLLLDFFTPPKVYKAKGVSQVLIASEGTVRLAIPAGKLPLGWSQAEPVGYVVSLAFARTESRTDYIFTDSYRPILATFRPDP